MSIEELGKYIKDRRHILKITQAYLANRAGISVNTLYKIERGQANPTLEVLLRIADIMGLTLEWQVRKMGIPNTHEV